MFSLCRNVIIKRFNLYLIERNPLNSFIVMLDNFLRGFIWTVPTKQFHLKIWILQAEWTLKNADLYCFGALVSLLIWQLWPLNGSVPIRALWSSLGADQKWRGERKKSGFFVHSVSKRNFVFRCSFLNAFFKLENWLWYCIIFSFLL